MSDTRYRSNHSHHLVPAQGSASPFVATVKVLAFETGSKVNKCVSATEAT